MKQILINKRIGASFWEDGILADSVREQLEAIPSNEDIRIVIDSVGGSAWECIAIFNVIRDHARQHKNQKIDTYIQGIAASAASIIALAAKSANSQNKIIVEDNSIFMIHNSWMLSSGDHRVFEKEAENLIRTDALMARTYCAISGKSCKEIHQYMDDETFFYGEEITDAGFADEVVLSVHNAAADPAEFASLKNASIANVKAECANICAKLNYEKEQVAFNKIAACLNVETPANASASADKPNLIPAPGAGVDVEGCMTVEELKLKNPEVYAAVLEQGVLAGEKKERERCDAHLKMGELSASLETSAKFIREGAVVASNDVQTAYFEKRIASTAQTARQADNTPAVQTPEANGNDGMAEAMKQFDAVLGGGK